jgi:hypothetical protein
VKSILRRISMFESWFIIHAHAYDVT